MDVEERNCLVRETVEDFLKRYKDEYNLTRVRTHQDSFGNVYDARNMTISEEKMLFEYLVKNPRLCWIEATDIYSKSRPFLDVDQNLDWPLLTQLLRKWKYECLVCVKCNLTEGKESVNPYAAHLIILSEKKYQKNVHQRFADNGFVFDQGCKISLRFVGQYKRKGDEIKKEVYLPYLIFTKFENQKKMSWFGFNIEDKPDKKMEEMLVPTEDKPWEHFENVQNDINLEIMAKHYFDIMKYFSIRNSSKERPTPSSQTTTPKSKAEILLKLQIIKEERFLCGPHTQVSYFDPLVIWQGLQSIIDNEELDAISKAFQDEDERNWKIVEYLNKHICFVAKGPGGPVIAYRTWDQIHQTTVFSFMTQDSFTKLVSNIWKIPFSDINFDKPGEPLSRSAIKRLQEANDIAKIWLQSQFRKSFIDIRFLPQFGPLINPIPDSINHTLNTYSGLAYTVEQMKHWYKNSSGKYWAANFNSFIFQIICNSDNHLFAYVLQFINFCLKFPHKNLQTMLYIYGGHGTGKSVFTNLIGKLFGRHAYFMNTFSEILTGGFNAHLSEAVLCIIDELDINQNGSSAFKSRITAEFIDLKKKFEQNRIESNCNKYLGTGNKSIHEVIAAVKSVETLTRRVVAIKIDPSFNILTNKKEVDERVRFMFKQNQYFILNGELCNSDPTMGIAAWAYGFFSDHNRTLFGQDALAKWEGGRFTPACANVSVQNVESTNNDILTQYLSYKFDHEDYSLCGGILKNPLLTAYWPEVSTFQNYPARIYSHLKKASLYQGYDILIEKLEIKKKEKDKEIVEIVEKRYIKEPTHDRIPWTKCVCIDLILEEITHLVEKKHLIVEQPKKMLTIQHLKQCFKSFTNEDSFQIPIPKNVYERYESSVLNDGLLCSIPSKNEAFDYAKAGHLRSKEEKKFTFIRVADFDTFKKTLVQVRKVLTQDMKDEVLRNDKDVFERLYGEDAVTRFQAFYDEEKTPPMETEETNPLELNLGGMSPNLLEIQ